MNEKIPSVIRWKRNDYMRLSGAVRQFNRKVKELQSLGIDYTPELVKYDELKGDIQSRTELNRIIKSLKRFATRETQQAGVTLPSGEKISKWQYAELRKYQKRALVNIQTQARNVIYDTKSGSSTRKLRQLNRTAESIKDLFNRKDYEFKRTASRTARWGKTDYDLWRASVFRENFMSSLEHMKNYDNYDDLVKKLSSIENPIQFYNYVNDKEILDIFFYYQDEASANTFGGFKDNQEAFDDAIVELGLYDEKELLNSIMTLGL